MNLMRKIVNNYNSKINNTFTTLSQKFIQCNLDIGYVDVV